MLFRSDDWREENRRTIVERAGAFRRALAGKNGWSIASIGAYFAYVGHPFTGRTAEDVARRLATDCGVLALPGTYFGGPHQDRFLRFAFANADVPSIVKIAERLDALKL